MNEWNLKLNLNGLNGMEWNGSVTEIQNTKKIKPSQVKSPKGFEHDPNGSEQQTLWFHPPNHLPHPAMC